MHESRTFEDGGAEIIRESDFLAPAPLSGHDLPGAIFDFAGAAGLEGAGRCGRVGYKLRDAGELLPVMYLVTLYVQLYEFAVRWNLRGKVPGCRALAACRVGGFNTRQLGGRRDREVDRKSS